MWQHHLPGRSCSTPQRSPRREHDSALDHCRRLRSYRPVFSCPGPRATPVSLASPLSLPSTQPTHLASQQRRGHANHSSGGGGHCGGNSGCHGGGVIVGGSSGGGEHGGGAARAMAAERAAATTAAVRSSVESAHAVAAALHAKLAGVRDARARIDGNIDFAEAFCEGQQRRVQARYRFVGECRGIPCLQSPSLPHSLTPSLSLSLSLPRCRAAPSFVAICGAAAPPARGARSIPCP